MQTSKSLPFQQYNPALNAPEIGPPITRSANGSKAAFQTAYYANLLRIYLGRLHDDLLSSRTHGTVAISKVGADLWRAFERL